MTKKTKEKLMTIFLLLIAPTMLLMNLGNCKEKSDTLHGENFITNIVDYKRLPLVEGTLNGQTVYFILDTGATVSILDNEQLKNYNVINKGLSEDYVVGYGGVDSESYELGNVNILVGKNLSLTEPFQGKNIKTIVSTVRSFSGKKIVGIIGNNNISSNKLILDFNKGIITK